MQIALGPCPANPRMRRYQFYNTRLHGVANAESLRRVLPIGRYEGDGEKRIDFRERRDGQDADVDVYRADSGSVDDYNAASRDGNEEADERRESLNS